MHILLINPPSPGDYPFTREGRCMQKEGVWTTVWPPISLCTIGAVLREAGFEVKIHDCPVEGINRDGLKTITADYKPDLLITNSSTPSIKHDLTIPALAKEAYLKVKVAAFGIHVGVLSEEVMCETPELDYILRGEPEFTALELAKALAKGETLQNIAGLSLRLNGKVEHFPDRGFFPDLDALPFPAWDLVNLDSYRLPFNRRKFVMVMSSRGCPYDCTFCVAQSYYGKKIRKRSAKRIVDEIEWNIKHNGISDFFFWSESFTILKKNIIELCDEIINRGLKIRWVCNSRADNIDRQMLGKMKSAGCWMISYGVESGEQAILDRAQKRITVEQVRNAVKLTRKLNFQIAGHFVLGLPGETEESLKKTEKLALELDLDYAQFYCASPWPGSRFYDEAKREGWLNTDDWDKYEQSFCVLDYPELSGERIMQIRDKMTKAFYYRPKIVWKTVKKIKSPTELKNFLGMIKDYLTWI
jgi:radical SAM superfamily enzyme YgiQ (UPF0313 family)